MLSDQSRRLLLWCNILLLNFERFSLRLHTLPKKKKKPEQRFKENRTAVISHRAVMNDQGCWKSYFLNPKTFLFCWTISYWISWRGKMQTENFVFTIYTYVYFWWSSEGQITPVRQQETEQPAMVWGETRRQESKSLFVWIKNTEKSWKCFQKTVISFQFIFKFERRCWQIPCLVMCVKVLQHPGDAVLKLSHGK